MSKTRIRADCDDATSADVGRRTRSPLSAAMAANPTWPTELAAANDRAAAAAGRDAEPAQPHVARNCRRTQIRGPAGSPRSACRSSTTSTARSKPPKRPAKRKTCSPVSGWSTSNCTRILSRNNCKPIAADGQAVRPEFPPGDFAAALADVPAGNVMMVTQQGYKLHDRVVRPAQVIVSRGPPAQVEQRCGISSRSSPDPRILTPASSSTCPPTTTNATPADTRSSCSSRSPSRCKKKCPKCGKLKAPPPVRHRRRRRLQRLRLLSDRLPQRVVQEGRGKRQAGERIEER